MSTPKKIIYIIPGYKHHPTNKAYKEITKILKKEGYIPIPIYIPWKNTTISENTTHFLTQFKKRRVKNKSILGFSFGAMIGFLASTKVPVAGLILCSLSPYFKEDVVKASRKLRSTITAKRYLDFSTLHAGTIAKQTKAKKILMMYGARETKPLIKRVTKTYAQIVSKRKHLIAIKATEHDIANKRYLKTIDQAIGLLN